VSFAGKRVNALIGATPGGGTDLTTRLVGHYMEKYLPGHPRVVYRNMPAGNGVQATNYFANEAKRDGSYWMGGGNAYIDAQAMRQPVVKYDPRTFHFLGGIARGGSLMNLRKEKVANLTDRKLPPVVIGTGDGTDTWAEMMCWGAEYLGWNMRFVVGYPGTAALMLALRRGEIDSFGTSSLSMLSGLRKQGAYKEIIQIGQMQNGKVVARGYAPDVPTMAALLDGKLSGVAQASFRYWSDSNQIDKWYALPPETPAPVVAAYRTAYLKVVTDPEFIKRGRAQISPDFGYQTADDLTRLVRDTSYPSADITAYMLKLRVKYGLPGQPLSDEELAKLAAKLVGEGKKVKSALAAVENGGRVIKFLASGADHKANVSGSRTKVTIAGKDASRSALKAGMACEISYSGDGGEATAINCN
jgi:tripartite-type tricarboxylate transporter receptor subunit TctC